jgi:hypothetical protein
VLDFSHKQEDFPFAFVRSALGMKLTFSLEETEQVWSDLLAENVEDIIVQRYIDSRGDKAHLIRLTWNLNSNTHVQFIHSNVDYKGTVLRDLDNETGMMLRVDLEIDRFLVTENSTVIPSHLTTSTSYLKQHLLAIKEILENYLLKDSTISQLTVDFMQDSMHRYHFIKIRSYKQAQRKMTRSMVKSNASVISEYPCLPDMYIQKSARSTNLITPISEYYSRNTQSEKVSVGNSPRSLLTKRTLSMKNIRVSANIKFKSQKPNSPPYVYNKDHEKELKLDDAVDNLLSYKSTLIKHLNYRKWIQRRNENQPLLPHDKLFANKLSFHLDTVKKKADESQHVMANMLDTMHRLTEGRYLTVTLLIKETMKFLLEKHYSRKEKFRNGSQMMKYKKIEERYQKLMNQNIVKSSEFRVRQQVENGARIYDDVMKKVYNINK